MSNNDVLSKCYYIQGNPSDIRTGQEWADAGIPFSPRFVSVPCALRNTASPTRPKSIYEWSGGAGVSFRDILLLAIAIKLSKTPQGLKLIEELGKSFLRMIGDALDSLGKASAANPVTAWANPYLISLVLERFGFVSGDRMPEFRIGLSIISGAVVAEDYLNTLQGIMPFSKPELPDFPSQIDLGDKTYVLEKPSLPEQLRYFVKKEKGKE